MTCAVEGRDGTQLGGCVKTYVPWPAGRFGGVLVAVSHPERPVGLRVIAFGVRHQPRHAHTLSVYEIAHRRLHGPTERHRPRLSLVAQRTSLAAVVHDACRKQEVAQMALEPAGLVPRGCRYSQRKPRTFRGRPTATNSGSATGPTP